MAFKYMRVFLQPLTMGFTATLCLPLAILLSAECDEYDLQSLCCNEDCGWNVQADYLLWWSSGSNVPPLVTSSQTGTPRNQAGVLGLQTTSLLYGGESIDSESRSGVRVALSRPWGRCTDTELMLSGFYIGEASNSADFQSNQSNNPILARPFFDVQSGQQASELVAYPQVVDGSVMVQGQSDIVGANALLSKQLRANCCGKFYGLIGYRFLRFSDELAVREDLVSTDLGGLIALGTRFDVRDSFEASNNFHGGDLGFRFSRQSHRWDLDLQGRLALGGLSRKIRISGETTVQVPSVAPNTTSGGLLALPTNIGNYSDTKFVVLPELSAGLSRRMSKRLLARVGYSVLVLPDVWRAGEQISPNINRSQLGGNVLVGSSAPEFQQRESNLWLHGLNLGASYSW